MNEQNGSESVTDGLNLSPGKLLADAREQLGLSIEEVANELYMTAYKVRMIEGDEFKKVNSDTFVRGYLKSYAILVKLDPTVVIAAYNNLAQEQGLIPKVIPLTVQSNTKKIVVLVAMLLAALIVLWLISVWFLDNRKAVSYNPPLSTVSSGGSSESSTSSNPVVLGDPADAIAVDADTDELAVNRLANSLQVNLQPTTSGIFPIIDSLDSSSVAASAQPVSVQPAATLPAQVSPIESLQATASSVSFSSASSVARAAVTGGLDELRLEFSAECWLQITDANGDVLASELERGGSIRVVQGRSPFEVKLGNAKAARLSLNGYDVPIEPRPGTNVRTLKIGR